MNERKLNPSILKVAEWLQQQANENPYAEVGVSLTIHGGEVRKIARTLTTKEKAEVRDNG